jgi:hypothetical protein
MCSSVFAENENARAVAIYQREEMEKRIGALK